MSEERGQRMIDPPVEGETGALPELLQRMSAQLAESYAALRKSEERFSLAMRGANDGLWDWDVRTGEVYYSPRWKEMLGYANDEIEPSFSAWERLVHPEDKPAAMKGVEAFLSGELAKFEIEFRMRHRDGYYVDILSRAFGVRQAPGGPVVRIVGTHVDITERKRSREQARRQSEYLAALHETTLGVVSQLDIGELLETLVERAVGLVDASFGFVDLVKPKEDELEFTVGTGWYQENIGACVKRGEALSGKIWQSGQPMAVEDYRTWPDRFLHPDLDQIGPLMGAPLMAGAEVIGAIGVARLPLAPPFQQDEMDLIVRFAHLASIALDNARLHTSLEQRVRERTHELATLNAVAAVVSRSLDLEEILSNALDHTMHTLDVEFGVAYRLAGDPNGTEDQLYLHPLVHRGLSESFVHAAKPLPLHATELGIAAASGQLEVWDVEDYLEASERQKLLWAEGGRQGVSVPLMAKGRLVGAMQLLTKRKRTFSPEQLSLMEAVGQQVGVAVENARLYKQAEQAAALAERSRLARELHDSVTQSLYSVTMYAEAAARLLTTGREATAAEYLRDARDTAQEALREMRLLIFELRPPALEQGGLTGALQARLDAVEKRAGVQAELRVSGVEGMAEAEWLPLAVQQELYQVAQEALNNSLKHAGADNLQVCLQVKADAVRLEVVDDGIGFDPTTAEARGGLGLPGMRERVQRIGGQLRIESAPGQGTTVSVEVPRGGENDITDPRLAG
ncbi:MAG: GAF domain-containing protein [Anaerolineae bacterium]